MKDKTLNIIGVMGFLFIIFCFIYVFCFGYPL